MVGAVQGLAGLTGMESGGFASDLKVNDGLLIVHALNGVCVAVFGQLDRAVIGIERGLVFAEVGVAEGRCGPEMGLRGLAREDLAVELTGCVDPAASLSSVRDAVVEEMGRLTQRCYR